MNKLTAMLMTLTCAAMVGQAADEPMIKLKLDLPKPLFTGTPPTLKSSNLEPKRTGPRPDMMVPEGVVNLAKGKPVTGSDANPVIGDLSMVTDGDKDGADGSNVELGPGKQYIQIDLGKTGALYAIAVWHYHSQARVYRDIVVQVSDDADFIKDVTTVFNNDHDNSSGLGVGKDKEYIETNEGKLIDAKGVKGRYVRLHSNGNTSGDVNHYIEVEVYGK
ncbi:MAG: discoidin domain-containing protein [bacterium]